MEKRARFRWGKGQPAEEGDAPDPTEPAPPPEPRRDEQRQPPGPPAPEYRVTDYAVSEYTVPTYDVPDYSVPEYDGPDLAAPRQPGPSRPVQPGAPQPYDPRQGPTPQGWSTAQPREGTARPDVRHGPTGRPSYEEGAGRSSSYEGGQGRSPSYEGGPGGYRSYDGAAWWEGSGAGRSDAAASGTVPRTGDGAPAQAREARGGAPGEAGALAGPGPRHAAPRAQEPAPQRGQGTRGPGAVQEADRWRRIVLGIPTEHVEPKPPPADPYRPDTIFDGWSTPHLTVRLASVRGDAHRFGGRPRQDDVVVAWHEPTSTVVFAVADGVSSAHQSHVGAALACRTAVNDLLVQLGEDRPGPDWSRVLKAAAYQLLMRVAHGREPSEADRAEASRTLATTLVTGTVTPVEGGAMRVTVIRAGDSSAWCLQGGRYAPLLHDEDAGSDDISSTAVVALPRLSARSRPMTYTLPADGVLLVGTDGFGVPLGDGTGLVGQLFADGLSVPPPEPRALAHLLDFSRETFDDDRTLLAVWPRHRLTGGTR